MKKIVVAGCITQFVLWVAVMNGFGSDSGGRIAVVEQLTIGRRLGRHLQGEVPATGNHVSVDGVSIFKIENGEIKSEHLYFDQVTFLSQLGLMPPQPTA